VICYPERLFLGGMLCRVAKFKLKKFPDSHSKYVVKKDTLAQFNQIFGFTQDNDTFLLEIFSTQWNLFYEFTFKLEILLMITLPYEQEEFIR
jgi:hypothetical protein